jgi:hypothetical protein
MSIGVGLDGVRVELVGDEIVVWKPGTVFLVAFRKSPHQQHLVVTRNWLSSFTSKPLAEFRSLAVRLGADKARSLGWLVNPLPKEVPRERPRLTLIEGGADKPSSGPGWRPCASPHLSANKN